MVTGLPRLLVAGEGPLPPERSGRLISTGRRLWGMARELAKAGHPVRLVCAEPGARLRPEARRYDLAWQWREEPHLPEPQPLAVTEGGWPALLAAQAADFGATAAIGSGALINHALAGSGLTLPLWLDFCGDPLAESQMVALGEGNDDGLLAAWRRVAPALARADRVSGCSATHCAALLGQLGAVGRLGRLTARERLVRQLAPWVEPIPIDIDCESIVRGRKVPADAFLIVQTGGFDAWLDVQTLFGALERAMAANPRIHFAAAGGALPGPSEGGLKGFAEEVDKSPFRDRYHLLGWLPPGQVPRLIGEGNLGLNVDLECAQGILGTRNRLLDWIVGCLPVISTPGCELARDLGDAGLITLVAHGSAEGVARAVQEKSVQSLKARQSATEVAAHWLRREHAPEVCLAPLLEWAAEPQPAGDRQAWAAGTATPPTLRAAALKTITPEPAPRGFWRLLRDRG